MKAADPNADQLAAEQAQRDAASLNAAAVQVLQGAGPVEVPAGLLTVEERQRVWAIFTNAAMRTGASKPRPVADERVKAGER